MPPKSSVIRAPVQAEERAPVASTPRAPRAAPKWGRLVYDDYLAETADLTPAQEGVYSRLCVLIGKSGDALPDAERALGYQTKAGKAWPRFRAAFLAAGLITIERGFIRQARCSEEVERARCAQDDRAAGGYAKAEAQNRHPVGLVREVEPQVIENIDNQPCSSTTDIDKDLPYPTGKVAGGNDAGTNKDPWEALDLPAQPTPGPLPPHSPPPGEPPAPAPSLSVVPLPDLTPEQQLTQAQRLMDKATVDALKAVGIPERSAWGLMAKWKKAIGRDKLLAMVTDMQRNPPAGPKIAWLTRMVQREADRLTTAGRSQNRSRGYGDY